MAARALSKYLSSGSCPGVLGTPLVFEGIAAIAPPSLDSPGTILYLLVNLSASDRHTVVGESGHGGAPPFHKFQLSGL